MNKMQVRMILERASKTSVKTEIGTLMRAGREEEAEELEKFQRAVKNEIHRLRRYDGTTHPGECMSQYAIIFARYIEGKSWVQVEREVHYSERQARTIHNHGLDRLGRAFECNPEIRKFYRIYIKSDSKKTAGDGS